MYTPRALVVCDARSCGGPNFVVVCRHFVVGGAAYANIVVVVVIIFIIIVVCIAYAIAVSLADDDRLDANDGPGLPPACPIRVDAIMTRGRPPFVVVCVVSVMNFFPDSR